MKRYLTLLCLQIFISTPSLILIAEEVELATKSNELLLFFEVADKSGFSKEQTVFLYEAFFNKLTKMHDQMVIKEAPVDQSTGKPPVTIEEKIASAKANNIETWILVRMKGQQKTQTLTVQVYDVNAAQNIVDIILNKEEELLTRTIERNYWDEVIDLLKNPLLERFHLDQPETTDVNLVTEVELQSEEEKSDLQTKISNLAHGGKGEIIIRAKPGTKIYGLSRRPLEVGTESVVAIEVLVPGTYSLEGRCKGFNTVKKDIYVEQKRTLLNLEQEEGARWAFDIYMMNISFLSIGFSYYLVPNTVFVKAGLNSYLLGFFFLNEQEDEDSFEMSRKIFISYPLINPYLSIGAYLNLENRLFRFYGTIGIFTRLFYSKGYGFGIEPIAPFGLQSTIGMEISTSVKLCFFTEWAPNFYFTRRPDLLMSSFQANTHNSGGLMNLGFMIFEHLNYQLGVRCKL